jgi:hypothetical protein
MRAFICASIAAGLLMAISAPPSVAAAGCHGPAATQLFLGHGVSGVRVRGIACRRAVRTLRRWAGDGMPGSGPPVWRCRSSRLNPDARRIRCTRRTARLRFDVGE